MGVVEAIAYAFARGCIRAWLDVIVESQKAVEEAPNEDDRRRAARFRDAVMRQPPSNHP